MKYSDIYNDTGLIETETGDLIVDHIRHSVSSGSSSVQHAYTPALARQISAHLAKLADEMDPPKPITREGIEALGWKYRFNPNDKGVDYYYYDAANLRIEVTQSTGMMRLYYGAWLKLSLKLRTVAEFKTAMRLAGMEVQQ